MKGRKEKSTSVRLLRAVSSLVLIGASAYVAFMGFNLVLGLIILSSFSGIAVPAVMAADSALECFTGFFELLLDGVMSFFEMIGDVFGWIFD